MSEFQSLLEELTDIKDDEGRIVDMLDMEETSTVLKALKIAADIEQGKVVVVPLPLIQTVVKSAEGGTFGQLSLAMAQATGIFELKQLCAARPKEE